MQGRRRPSSVPLQRLAAALPRDWLALAVLPEMCAWGSIAAKADSTASPYSSWSSTHAGEVGQRLERQRPAAGAPRCPHHHLGVAQVVGGARRVGGLPAAGRFRPREAEPRQVVVGVQHDRRHSAQRALLDEPSDQHGLARSGAREDRGVLAQCEQVHAQRLARGVVDAKRHRRGGVLRRVRLRTVSGSSTGSGSETGVGSGISAAVGAGVVSRARPAGTSVRARVCAPEASRADRDRCRRSDPAAPTACAGRRPTASACGRLPPRSRRPGQRSSHRSATARCAAGTACACSGWCRNRLRSRHS